VIVDSSALIAVLRGEADANRYVDALAAARGARMSAPTYMETAAVVDGSGDPVLSRRLEELISTADIEITAFTPEQAGSPGRPTATSDAAAGTRPG